MIDKFKSFNNIMIGPKIMKEVAIDIDGNAFSRLVVFNERMEPEATKWVQVGIEIKTGQEMYKIPKRGNKPKRG